MAKKRMYSFAKEKQMKCKFVAHVSFVYDNIITL